MDFTGHYCTFLEVSFRSMSSCWFQSTSSSLRFQCSLGFLRWNSQWHLFTALLSRLTCHTFTVSSILPRRECTPKSFGKPCLCLSRGEKFSLQHLWLLPYLLFASCRLTTLWSCFWAPPLQSVCCFKWSRRFQHWQIFLVSYAILLTWSTY